MHTLCPLANTCSLLDRHRTNWLLRHQSKFHIRFCGNYPRTTCVTLSTTSFLNHGRKLPSNLEISGANYEGSQSPHYRSCRYLSPCSSGSLCRSCEHFVSCSRHVCQNEVDHGQAQSPQRLRLGNGSQ